MNGIFAPAMVITGAANAQVLPGCPSGYRCVPEPGYQDEWLAQEKQRDHEDCVDRARLSEAMELGLETQQAVEAAQRDSLGFAVRPAPSDFSTHRAEADCK
jgi:hypothetical protein